MKEIDEIFKAFGEKKQKEQEEIEERNKAAQTLREKVHKVLDEIVLPVIKELSAVIKQKGHKTEYKREFGYIEFSFTPFSTYPASLLKFHHDGSGAIVIVQIVNRKDGLDLEEPDKFPSVVPNGANQEWIRSRIIDFIKRVLETN